MRFNKSFILLEIILSIVIISIILTITTKFIFDINIKNNNDYQTNLTKIEFETTKLFLQKKLAQDHNLTSLSYLDNQLFFNNHLLQNNVTNFTITNKYNKYTITICIKLQQNICQTWIIK